MTAGARTPSFTQALGFKPYWFGGMRDDAPTWISLQVPDGSDWLEYMIVGTPGGRGIPADMKPADLGILNHFSLGVANIETTYTLLWNGERLAGQTNVPKIGRDAKWQLNLLDPDGTRAEIMELHAIGKPCCSLHGGRPIPLVTSHSQPSRLLHPLLVFRVACVGGRIGYRRLMRWYRRLAGRKMRCRANFFSRDTSRRPRF